VRIHARIDKSNMVRIPDEGFPRCSKIMRLLIKDASKNEARQSTESPACGAARHVYRLRQSAYGRGGVSCYRIVNSARHARSERI
jgi:hypothetical protein